MSLKVTSWMWLAWAEHWGVFPASGILDSLLCDHPRLTLYPRVLFGVVHAASILIVGLIQKTQFMAP